MKIKKIETKRLYLRGLGKEDVSFTMSVWNDPEMGEYLPDPSINSMREEEHKSLETLGAHDTFCYLITESKITSVN